MKTYQTNSIWAIEPRHTDSVSIFDLDCECSRCLETKKKDVFIYIWNEDSNYKYCESCSHNRVEVSDNSFQTIS